MDQFRGQNETNFRLWFGSSTILHPTGQPRTLYHGTAIDFDSFSPTYRAFYGSGIYLTDDPEYAAEHGEEEEGQIVLPVYLKLENPFTFLAPNADQEPTNFTLAKTLFTGAALRRVLAELKDYGELTGAIQDRLEHLGYDGLIVAVPGEPVEYVAFRPEQVKSIFNSGEWDPESASLTDLDDCGSMLPVPKG